MREQRYQIEQAGFSEYAFDGRLAENLRRYQIKSHRYRTALQRDRDRILHSRTFRRLKHKRQVFFINVGDHYRTRITHTIEVAQLSRTIARAMCLNEDLAEAIAFGHDVGHTPFGHLGEVVLSDIMYGNHGDKCGFPQENYGGFKHNYQSLRVLDQLEQKYSYPGLNLSAPVREGILKHTRLKKNVISYPDFNNGDLFFEQEFSSTLEGQIVAVADEIAQRTHDLEDGLRANFVSIDKIQHLDIVQHLEKDTDIDLKLLNDSYQYRNFLITNLIEFLVTDVIENSLRTLQNYSEKGGEHYPITEHIIDFSTDVLPLQLQLNKFIYQHIIFVPEVQSADEQIKNLVLALFDIYSNDPNELPESTRQKVGFAQSEAARFRIICDHIAGMTDNYAVEQFQKLRAKSQLIPEININVIQPVWIK
ncbi:MAG: dNTP triphosphohydrolase [Deferribacteres bacterium]|nr:dNTP triphosphohydrolase [candidate division KSB1 bacterium]MCB9501517.1 dNTP triphosphohydrolase [Deferribacteres bacterium]